MKIYEFLVFFKEIFEDEIPISFILVLLLNKNIFV